jgi:hypothetical protein
MLAGPVWRTGREATVVVAHHARAERWHRHVIWPRVRAQDRPMVAQPAAHVERPHAVGAHVADAVVAPNVENAPWRLARSRATHPTILSCSQRIGRRSRIGQAELLSKALLLALTASIALRAMKEGFPIHSAAYHTRALVPTQECKATVCTPVEDHRSAASDSRVSISTAKI